MTDSAKPLPLPEKIKMSSRAYLDGDNGMRSQVFDNAEHGVTYTSTKESHSTDWVGTWTATRLPGREFRTYEALRQAAADQIQNKK
jgi:hypothetical protein